MMIPRGKEPNGVQSQEYVACLLRNALNASICGTKMNTSTWSASTMKSVTINVTDHYGVYLVGNGTSMSIGTNPNFPGGFRRR